MLNRAELCRIFDDNKFKNVRQHKVDAIVEDLEKALSEAVHKGRPQVSRSYFFSTYPEHKAVEAHFERMGFWSYAYSCSFFGFREIEVRLRGCGG